jgi:hypothetical protein
MQVYHAPGNYQSGRRRQASNHSRWPTGGLRAHDLLDGGQREIIFTCHSILPTLLAGRMER